MSTAAALDAGIPLPHNASDLGTLRAALDASDEEGRLRWMRSLGFKQQHRLWEMSEGTTLRPSALIPADGSVLIAEGKNGLPLFSRFQKRFARVDDHFVGYNHNGWLATWFGGYGHFVLEQSPEHEGELWVNYCKVPEVQHPEFPKVHSNDRWFANIVYGDMIDRVRRVSAHIVIGTSFKPSGKWGLNDGQYFALHVPPTQ